MIYVLIIVGILALDRFVKFAVDSNMNLGESFSVIGEFFRITYVQNRGAAFNILDGETTILTVVPIIIIMTGMIIVFIFRKKFPRLMLVAISLMCAGGIGNLLDRATRGYVIDMFDFGDFPVFNVADIAVCTGCGLMILSVLLSKDSDKDKG